MEALNRQGLDERKRQILKAIVDDYIETAEPVGSRNLVDRHALNLSSATVRNEMSDLESLGYLEQPHTSAGRIPSDLGYREYVDHLMRVDELTPEESAAIRDRLRDSFDEVTELLRKASGVLASQTGYTSLAVTPRVRQSHLRQLKMLMIEPGRALVVVVLAAGVVKDRLVRIPDALDADMLARISSAIEEGLSGMRLEDITLVTVATAASRARLPETLLNQVLYEAYVSIKQADNLEVYLEGQHRMLEYPEFRDVDRARTYLEAIHRDGIIAGYLSEDSCPERDEEEDEADPRFAKTVDDQGTTAGIRRRCPYMIRIGQEISLDGMRDCSFVTTTYKVGDRIVGNIGVIGPKRMEYARVVSNIQFVRKALNENLRRLMVRYGKQGTEEDGR